MPKSFIHKPSGITFKENPQVPGAHDVFVNGEPILYIPDRCLGDIMRPEASPNQVRRGFENLWVDFHQTLAVHGVRYLQFYNAVSALADQERFERNAYSSIADAITAPL